MLVPEVRIYSSDKDLMQLVNNHISLVDPMKNKILGKEEVFAKFGVYPEFVTDVQALAGDSTDNIPGVPGIGVKTAAQLIHEYGDLETLLNSADQIKQKKRRENLIEFAENARISHKLVTLDDNVPLNVAVSDLSLCEIDKETVISFLREMEFTSLTKRVMARMGMAADDIQKVIPQPSAQSDLFGAPQVAAQTETITNVSYQAITDLNTLKSYIAEIEQKGIVAFEYGNHRPEYY